MIIYSKILDLLTPANRRSALLLLVLMFIGMILEMIGIGLVVPVIALLTQENTTSGYPQLQNFLNSLGNPTQEQLIVGAMMLLVGSYLLKNLFLAFLAWKQARFVFGLKAEISQRLFALYLRQPYTFHLQRNSAQLIRNVQGEVNMFTNSAVTAAAHIITEALVLFGLFVLLIIVEPVGILIVVTVLGIAAWGFHRTTKEYVTRWGRARQYHDGLSIQHLHQGLGGAKDVKLLGRESDFLNQFGIHTIQSAKMNQLQSTLLQMPRLWLELLGVVGLAALVLSMLAQGREMTTILPTLGLFAAAAFRLMPSVNRILGSIQTLRYGLPAVDTLHRELNLAIPEKQVSQGTTFNKGIQLVNISYTYPSTRMPALNGVSLNIQKGESIGVIGSSGSGKSTLVDVVLGLLSPSDGQVMVDEQDIQNNLRAWQDQIGYVPQSIYLTDDTLKRNVAFGLPNDQIDDAAVKRAIEAAQLMEFINSLPAGLDTIVGERGVRLSGGQRQRIGIARALYHDPTLLVLDEATSALDTTTEHGVMQAVNALKGSKTILIVAHRLSTVEHCNRLYRLEQGRIEEEGTPAEILSIKRGTSSA